MENQNNVFFFLEFVFNIKNFVYYFQRLFLVQIFDKTYSKKNTFLYIFLKLAFASNFIVRPALSTPSSVSKPKTTRGKSDASIRYRHPTLSHIISNSFRNMGTQEDPHQAGYFHMSSDISSMFSIRDKIQQLVELSIQIVIENDATPEIENEFEPVLRAIENTYPLFHKQGLHYFSTLCSMQETAKTNQILSSAGVKLPLQNFTNDWKKLCTVIDHFSNIHPPPHAKEIASKFKAVRSSLDTIKKTNERRKQPTPGITNCITNILALGKSVSKNIDDLFTHNYINFESNLFDSLKGDVKSFLTVINEAFSNEFVQSGVMLCDLYRIRSNIFTDCNEIVESLKSAFVFPKEMREIKQLKDTTEIELKQIFDKLSVQFVVIKPNQQDAISEIAPSESNNLQISDEKNNSDNDQNALNFLERDEIIPQILPKQDYLTAINKIDDFVEKFLEIFDRKVDYTKDTWDNLDEIKKFVLNYKKLFEETEKQTEVLKNKINALIEKNKDNEILFDKKNEALVLANEFNKSKIQKIDSQNQDLNKKCIALQKENEKLRLKYSNLKAKGDASVFRKALIEIGKSINPNSKIDFLHQQELINVVKIIVKDEIEKPCENCALLDEQLKKVKNDLIMIIEKVKNQKNDLPEKSYSLVIDEKPKKEKKKITNIHDNKKSKKNEVFKSTSELLKVNDSLSNSFVFTTQPDPSSETVKSKSCNKLTKCTKKTASVVIRVNSNQNILSKSSNTDSSDNAINPLDILRSNYESSDATSETYEEMSIKSLQETRESSNEIISLKSIKEARDNNDFSSSSIESNKDGLSSIQDENNENNLSTIQEETNQNGLSSIQEENNENNLSTTQEETNKTDLSSIQEETNKTDLNSVQEENSDKSYLSSIQEENNDKSELKVIKEENDCSNKNGSISSINDKEMEIKFEDDSSSDLQSKKENVADNANPFCINKIKPITDNFISSDIDTLIKSIDCMFESKHEDIINLIQEASITKKPVIEAILMIDKDHDKKELFEALPSRLKTILHNLIHEILNKSDEVKQAFKKREIQYVKTMFQIGEKLAKITNEEKVMIEFDESQEISKERDKIIDLISSQLKTVKQIITNLENDYSSQKKSNSELRKQRDSIRLSFCSLYNFYPDVDDKINIEKCRQILEKEKNGYREKIENLTQKVEKLESDAVAIEELINGVSREKEGTLTEKLGKMHDKSDRLIQKQNEMKDEISKLKEAVVNIAAILENRNDMNDDESLIYINEFCKKHNGGIRIIDNSKFDLLFEKLEYSKEDSLYEILEDFMKKK